MWLSSAARARKFADNEAANALRRRSTRCGPSSSRSILEASTSEHENGAYGGARVQRHDGRHRRQIQQRHPVATHDSAIDQALGNEGGYRLQSGIGERTSVTCDNRLLLRNLSWNSQKFGQIHCGFSWTMRWSILK